MMRALTVKQPWASLIVMGIKDVENRTWTTPYRGRILIHAGKELRSENFATINDDMFPGDAWERMCAENGGGTVQDYPRGSIIGEAELFDIVENSSSRWAIRTPGTFHWCLRNAKPVPHLAMRGQQGLWVVPT